MDAIPVGASLLANGVDAVLDGEAEAVIAGKPAPTGDGGVLQIESGERI